MQVDGEACRLNPATIELSFLNQVKIKYNKIFIGVYSCSSIIMNKSITSKQVVMMEKMKGAKSKTSSNTMSGEFSDASCSSTYGAVERSDLRLSVSRIRMSDYETHHHNKEKLKGKNSK